jgi:hypothetical protein
MHNNKASQLALFPRYYQSNELMTGLGGHVASITKTINTYEMLIRKSYIF